MEKRAFKIEVSEEDDSKRLDKFLVEKMRDKYSRSFLQGLIKDAHVLVDGERRKSHYTVSPGEYVEIEIPAPVKWDVAAEKIPLDIVYEDSELLVVNKKPEMVVHPAPGNYTGTLVNALLAHCKNLSGIGGVIKPGIVHRLDKGTSGLLVVAKTDRAHRFLAKQFKAKTTKRVYVAIVKGVIELDNGVVNAPIGRDKRDRMKMAVDFDEEGKTREATTSYHVLKRFKDSTMIELSLGTGRTHQIRVHMAYIGYPVMGDVKYGASYGLKRAMLHAKTIGFIHPVKKKFMEFTSDLPKDMKRLIASKKI